MNIVLVRHLSTNWNKQSLLQGSKNIPIDRIMPEEEKIINQNKTILQKYDFDVVLTSSLIRTKQTAEVYNVFQHEEETLLNELDFGDYEGKSKQLLFSDLGEIWTDNPRDLRLGESLIDFEKRILSFIEKYQNYKSVLVFGHGAWIRGFLSICEVGHINNMNKIEVKNNDIIEYVVGG